MKCLMPLNQRKVIAEAIEGADVVEYGCGGTTQWLLENSNLRTLTTIENVRTWLEECMGSIDPFWHITGRWRPRYVPCTVGQNATRGEEEAACNHEAYLYRMECLNHQPAKVFLIDGVLRAQCLREAVELCDHRKYGTIFIHDTQRDWYDEAIAEAIAAGFTRTDYPEGEDYPGCLLTKLEKK